MFYSGQKTQVIEYDFSGKIKIPDEYPLDIYYSISEKIHKPTDNKSANSWDDWSFAANTAYEKLITIANDDKKYFRVNAAYLEKGKGLAQIMLVLDVSPFIAKLYKGDGDKFKENLKSISLSVKSECSGEVSGIKGYAKSLHAYDFSKETWSLDKIDTTKGISQTKIEIKDKNDFAKIMQADGKIYFLLKGIHRSGESISSILDLYYAKFRIEFNSYGTSILNFPSFLPNKGSILTRISLPYYDDTTPGYKDLTEKDKKQRTLFDFNDNINKNAFKCNLGTQNEIDTFEIKSIVGGKEDRKVEFLHDELLQYKIPYRLISILFNWDKEKLEVFTRYHGSFKHFIIKKPNNLPETFYRLFVSTDAECNNQLDGFVEEFQFMPDKNWSEDEANNVLAARQKYFIMPNIFNYFNTKQTSVLAVTRMISSLDDFETSFSVEFNDSTSKVEFTPTVLPNNKYYIKARIKGTAHIKIENITEDNEIINSTSSFAEVVTTSSNLKLIITPGYNWKKGEEIEIEDLQIRLVP